MIKLIITDMWQVKGFWPYIPLSGKSIETGNEFMGVTEKFMNMC